MEISLGASTDKALGAATAIGTGLLAWEYAATGKWVSGPRTGYGPFSKYRFGDALAGLIGNSNTAKLIPGWGGDADFKPNFGGWMNKFTFAGVGLKIADWIAREVWHGYKGLGIVPEVISNAATGLIVGGAVGGIFDPEPTAADMNRGAQGQNGNYPNVSNGLQVKALTFHS